MSTRGTALALGLLALTPLAGMAALAGRAPGSSDVGIWPAALGTIACLVVARGHVVRVATALVVLNVLTLWMSGQPTTYAVLVGLGLAAQSVITWRALAGPHDGVGLPTGRPDLRTMADVARLLRAVSAGAVALAATGLVVGLVTHEPQPTFLAIVLALGGVAAEVAVLPLFCRMRVVDSSAHVVERAVQWVVLLIVAVLVFAPADAPPLVIVLFPVLAWICLRGNSVDARAKVVLLQAVAVVMTALGRGPLARPDLDFPVPIDAQTMLLSVFIAVTAIQVLVLAVSVGEQASISRVVEAERDRIRGVVHSINSTAVICTDPNGLITFFNPGAERLLGYREAEVCGRTAEFLYSSAAIKAKATELGVVNRFARVALELMDQGPVEMGFLRKDGVERCHLMSLHRVLDRSGQLFGFVATSKDITEMLEAKERLVESLEHEREAADELREIDRVKDAFVSSVSHELRTPLTSILGYVELLQDGSYGPLAPQQDAVVARIHSSSTRLLSLICDLLDLGRMQEGAEEPGEHLEMASLVRSVLPILAPAASRGGVQLTIDLADEPLPVRGRRAPLERVVMNLVDNAIKFTASDGRVDVGACVEGEFVVVRVADTGMGIPVAEQAQLFERFFRSSTAQSRAIPGSGLGLAITRTIVEQHGGRIAVASTPGVGTTFTVWLPLDPDRVAGTATVPTRATGGGSFSRGGVQPHATSATHRRAAAPSRAVRPVRVASERGRVVVGDQPSTQQVVATAAPKPVTATR